jgi:hypothetical protein
MHCSYCVDSRRKRLRAFTTLNWKLFVYRSKNRSQEWILTEASAMYLWQ